MAIRQGARNNAPVERDVVALGRQRFHELELVADAQRDRRRRSPGQESVVPASAMPETSPVASERESGYDPYGRFAGWAFPAVFRLQNVMRPRHESRIGSELHQRVGIAIPCRNGYRTDSLTEGCGDSSR